MYRAVLLPLVQPLTTKYLMVRGILADDKTESADRFPGIVLAHEAVSRGDLLPDQRLGGIIGSPLRSISRLPHVCTSDSVHLHHPRQIGFFGRSYSSNHFKTIFVKTQTAYQITLISSNGSPLNIYRPHS